MLSLEQPDRDQTKRRGARESAGAELLRRARDMQQDPRDAWAEISYNAKWRSFVDKTGVDSWKQDFFEMELPGSIGDERRAELQIFAARVEDVLLAAFPGMQVRTFATHQPWRTRPVFHVDQAAFTLIAPLRNAPTLFAPDAGYSAECADIPLGLPLGMETRSATPEGQVLLSGKSAFFLIKGVGWRADHAPLVHSPPALLEANSGTLPTASALIFEMRHD